MTGPHTDTELFTRRDAIRVQNTLRELKKLPIPFKPKKNESWYDVGSGDSIMRQALVKYSGIKPFTFNLDLDNTRISTIGLQSVFDVITSIEVIEHLLNPLFHMENLRDMLRPSGRLFLTTPNDYSLIYKAEHLLSKKYDPHFHQFSESDLRELCRRAGIEILYLRKFRRSAGIGTLARISKNGLLLIGAKQ